MTCNARLSSRTSTWVTIAGRRSVVLESSVWTEHAVFLIPGRTDGSTSFGGQVRLKFIFKMNMEGLHAQDRGVGEEVIVGIGEPEEEGERDDDGGRVCPSVRDGRNRRDGVSRRRRSLARRAVAIVGREEAGGGEFRDGGGREEARGLRRRRLRSTVIFGSLAHTFPLPSSRPSSDPSLERRQGATLAR